MLIGQYQTNISEKGRVSLPAKFKKNLGTKVIITAGYEQSLMIVAYKDWQTVVGQVTNQGLTVGPARATDRFLLGSAFEIEIDAQGRFIIPKYLRQYGSLNEAVVFVGVGSRVELWSQINWDKYSQYLNKNISELSERLSVK